MYSSKNINMMKRKIKLKYIRKKNFNNQFKFKMKKKKFKKFIKNIKTVILYQMKVN